MEFIFHGGWRTMKNEENSLLNFHPRTVGWRRRLLCVSGKPKAHEEDKGKWKQRIEGEAY